MNKNVKLCLLSTLLVFMIASGPLLAIAAPYRSADPAESGESAEMYIGVLEDEAVDDLNPDTNYYAYEHRGGLWVGYDGSDMARSWLKFGLTNIPKELGINSVYLNVYLFDEYDTQDLPVGVYYSESDSWQETTITWNLQPTFDTTPLDVIDSPASPNMFVLGNWYSFDVTSAFVDSLSTDKMLSLVLKQVDEAATTATWNYFLDKDYSAATAFNASYLSVHYTTPDVVGMNVDGEASAPLVNYIQDSTPTLGWDMYDSGIGEYQRDYELEVWNNEYYNDTLLWEQKHTDAITVHDSSTGSNSRPFGTAAEFRYQMKFPAADLPRSGVVDKIMFEVNTLTGEMKFENLQIFMLSVTGSAALTSDFAANYQGLQPTCVLNHPNYTVPIVNGRILFDVENTFFLHRGLYLIIELRFTNNFGDLSTTTYTTGAGGSVAYDYGTDASISTTALVTSDRYHSLDVFFESDEIFDPATAISNDYPFGTDLGYPGRYQIKYNQSLISDTGVIDKIWFPIDTFSGNVVYENLTIKLVETPVQGYLSYTDFESNYGGVTPVTVLDRDLYEVRNLGYVLLIDIDNFFHYSGDHDLLIDMQWDDLVSGHASVYRDLDAGAYRAWNLTWSGNVAGNDTRTNHMYFDFLHSETSIEYAGTALTNATTYYWRVRSCDSTGIWSDWTTHQFKYEELSSVPEFEAPIVDPIPVQVNDPVTVSINVTYFLGINEVLMEYGGSNHTMTADGDTYSLELTPSTVANITFTIYMESNVGTWSSTSGLIVVTEAAAGIPIDPTLLLIIGAAAVVVIIILVIVMKKKK